MDRKSALTDAEALLDTMIKNQPNLLVTGTGSSKGSNGKEVADFCSTFVETYAQYLVDRK